MENTNKNLDQMPKKSPFSFQVDLSKAGGYERVLHIL